MVDDGAIQTSDVEDSRDQRRNQTIQATDQNKHKEEADKLRNCEGTDFPDTQT